MGLLLMICAASASRWAAWNSPSAAITLARRSRSASACAAIARCISCGRSIFFNSTSVTFTPHGSVCESTISWMRALSLSRWLSNSSSSVWPPTERNVVCASCIVANRKFSTSVTAREGSTTRKYRTALTLTVTLSLVITSCGGMSSVTVRRSIRAIRSSTGITKITPGPRYGVSRPRRKTTPRSYSLSTLSPLRAKIIPMKITIPTPPAIAILLRPLAREALATVPSSLTLRQLLNLQLQTVDRFHASARAGTERVAADRSPNLATHENFAGRAGTDRLPHLAHLADDTLRAGRRAPATLARHDISDAENYQRQRRRCAVYNVAINRQVALRRVDKKQRADDKRRHPAQPENSVAGDKGLGNQHADAEKNQQQAGEIYRQHLERRERKQQANRAGHARKNHSRMRE